MYKLDVYCLWDLNLDVWLNQPCELFVDVIPNTKEDKTRVLLVIEPNEITGFRDEIIKKKDYFNLIITWDDIILSLCNNAILLPFGGCWIKDFNFLKEKKYEITTLIGGKLLTDNHYLRHSLIEVKNYLYSIKLNIFNSLTYPMNNPNTFSIINNKEIKNELFYSQFHISIENVTRNNWFTEKLIDCFQTRTIPIYIGCPNIGDYFDNRGIIQINNLDEMVIEINKITPQYYNSKLEYIENNYNLSKKYVDFKQNLKNIIESYVNSLN